MNNKFDELAKGLAQSVTRRGALKKFGVGLAGAVLGTLGLANKAEAHPKPCQTDENCAAHKICVNGGCYYPCNSNADCRLAVPGTWCGCWGSGRTDYPGICACF